MPRSPHAHPTQHHMKRRLVMNHNDFYGVRKTLHLNGHPHHYYDLDAFEKKGYPEVSKLPFSMKVLLEAALRQWDGRKITTDHIEQIANWPSTQNTKKEIPFIPARIVLQDFTGVPVIVDLAAMRATLNRMGGDPKKINPLLPVDLVIDHSVMVDDFGTNEALQKNMNLEFSRNEERYRFLRWAQTAFENLRVVPPSVGIVHQVNLEYLSSVVVKKTQESEPLLYPDSLVGTDSHTTMINGLGILGWGVGGIEAEAAMLGQPLYFLTPQVIGFRLTGHLSEGATATDLALTITQMLRKKGVVGKFVEFYGPGVGNMRLADRATVANMAPEYGATVAFFPVDEESLHYLRSTGRSEEQIQTIETYYKAQGLFRQDETPDPVFSETLHLDLSDVVPSLAGPKRPQDKVALSQMKEAFHSVLRSPVVQGGYGLSEESITKVHALSSDAKALTLKTGSVVIAAITSCTNTSNPSVMVAAGLLAKKAIERGLKTAPHVKTSLTPGSRVVTDYLKKANLMEALKALGFHVAGYGCATCIGNSGPLPEDVHSLITENDLTVCSVLSGNRNFEGRIHSKVKANYLASPPLVVAYALAGTMDIDLTKEPIAMDPQGTPVYLKDIWPSAKEVEDLIFDAMSPKLYRDQYAQVFSGNERWNLLSVPEGDLYEWDAQSTYIKEPPFFDEFSMQTQDIKSIHGASVLAMLADSVTTDHISPAGNISSNSPAGKYLQEQNVNRGDFNSYGARRGNHEVMMRGTFANIRIRNLLASHTEGGYTTHLPTLQVMSIYEASMKYQSSGIPLIVLAGKEYGTGSSRDWAAKGTFLLGVKAVIAIDFERIHRSNLVGMGVLPLQFKEGENVSSHALDGTESFDILDLNNDLKPGQEIRVVAVRKDGSEHTFKTIARLDSLVEVDIYRNGGILQTVLRQMIDQNES
jgi:aconitate hydratase